jgi:hypothetical protein
MPESKGCVENGYAGICRPGGEASRDGYSVKLGGKQEGPAKKKAKCALRKLHEGQPSRMDEVCGQCGFRVVAR